VPPDLHRQLAQEAAEAGINYLSIGPLFCPSAGKDAPGIDSIRLIKKRVKVPVFAEGAITPETVPDIIIIGAEGVMAMDIICSYTVESSVRELKERILKIEADQEKFIKE
jgi:thiamine monophosphate synthase